MKFQLRTVRFEGARRLFFKAGKPPIRQTMELVSDTEIRQSGSIKASMPKFAQTTLNTSDDCGVIRDSISTWIDD